MGIKDLSSFLRKNYPSVFREGHISEFSEQKVAVDASAFVFKYHTAAGERWWRSMVNFVASFRQHNVHPVFVFDSSQRPPEKEATMESRREAWSKTISRRDRLESALKTHAETGIIGSPLAKYTVATTGTTTEQALLGDDSESVVDTDSAVNALNKLKDTTRELPKEYFTRLQAFLDVCGVPWVIAPYEADPLCAWLCKHGHVSAALSPDSDLYAYGCPRIIKEYSPGSGIITTINLEEVYSNLRFSVETFTDFCVMLGNDNNPRIPKIGPVKSYSLLEQHGSIDQLPGIIPTECLNHVRSREIFGGVYEQNFNQVIEWCELPDLDELDSFLHDTQAQIGGKRLQLCFGPREITLE